MKRIKYHHHLQQSNRLIIQSIRLELKKQQLATPHRKRYVTLPDNHISSLSRSQTKRRLCNSNSKREEGLQVQHQHYSIPVKLDRWQPIYQQQLKRIKSNIQEKRLQNSIDITAEQSSNKKSMLRLGPLIFVKDMFHDTPKKMEKQQRKINNILKFKSLKGADLIRKDKSHESHKDNLAVSSLKLSIDLPKLSIDLPKLSIDLPKLRAKNKQIFKQFHTEGLSVPYRKLQRGLILQKSERKKPKKFKIRQLSPWSTKSHIFSPSDIAMQ